MSSKTDERIDDMRARIDRLQMRFGAVEHRKAEQADTENDALASVTQDYVNDLAEIKRELDETAQNRRAKTRRHAESAGEKLRRSPDTLGARLASLERKADELFKKRD